MSTPRRFWSVTSGVVVTALLAAACGAPGSRGESSASDDTFKLGVLVSLKGAFATSGEKVEAATVDLYLKEHDNELGGRKVEVVTGDGETDPEAFVTKGRQLVEQDGVDAIVGIDNSGAALALRDYLDEKQIPTVIPIAGAREITNEAKSDWIFRTGYTIGQMEPVGAVYAYKELGYRRIALMASDFPGATGVSDAFKSAFEELGGTVVSYQKPPLGTADFSSYLAKLQRDSDVDAVVPIVLGTDGARLVEQYRDLGLKLPIYSIGNFAEQTQSLDVWGDKAIGMKLYWLYSSALKNPENQSFVAAYQAAYDRLPGGFSATTWTAMQMIDAALAEQEGEAFDKDAFVTALESAKVDSPLGQVHFDARHALTQNVYLTEVEQTADGPAQVPVGPVVRDVTQDETVDDALDRITSVQ
ncbi:ABC transporter substrate-binding protein [Nocardioides acrostichi]|uniref:ABC transporter substrate-binding protein n=1 Tax=Nocardioides acrostichi TaxID=2784339 RepID=A0A930V0M7_9ACTN|nr:ABC transporter substrate-binding protein [Nocardioides acrostichi]MBF4161567.1 ABC transporter substrate-binding protein [Nocardioides acrostichi]